jgi:hypothetical protein
MRHNGADLRSIQVKFGLSQLLSQSRTSQHAGMGDDLGFPNVGAPPTSSEPGRIDWRPSGVGLNELLDQRHERLRHVLLTEVSDTGQLHDGRIREQPLEIADRVALGDAEESMSPDTSMAGFAFTASRLPVCKPSIT